MSSLYYWYSLYLKCRITEKSEKSDGSRFLWVVFCAHLLLRAPVQEFKILCDIMNFNLLSPATIPLAICKSLSVFFATWYMAKIDNSFAYMCRQVALCRQQLIMGLTHMLFIYDEIYWRRQMCLLLSMSNFRRLLGHMCLMPDRYVCKQHSRHG